MSVGICCTCCARQGAMFETNINEPRHTNAVSMCVQVASLSLGVLMQFTTKF